MKTKLSAFFFFVFMVFIGFAMGAMLGGKFMVQSGDGLAGGTTVFFYGVIGSIIDLFLAVLLIRKLSPKQLQVAFFISALLTVLIFGGAYYSYKKKQANLEEQTEKPMPVDTAGTVVP